MLWFTVEGLALAIYIDRPKLAIVIRRTSWVVTECKLCSFSTKGYKICLQSFNILKRLLLVNAIYLSKQETQVPLR